MPINRPNGRALLVNVYRAAGPDCTNNGVTRTADRLLVVGATVEGFLDVSADEMQRGARHDGVPIVELVPGVFPGTAVLKPRSRGDRWVMFGGNYAASSDDRFSAAIEIITGRPFYGAIPVHDRIE